MQRPYNFSAGPAAISPEVLSLAASEMLDWHGSGMGVMEMSHRGKEFISIYEAAEADLRELLAVPPQFKILFMQGGGLAENAILPLNLSRAATADYVVTGSWSDKSQKEARKYCEVNLAASNTDSTPNCPTRPAGNSAVAPATCTCAPTKPSTASSSTHCPTWPHWAATPRW